MCVWSRVLAGLLCVGVAFGMCGCAKSGETGGMTDGTVSGSSAGSSDVGGEAKAPVRLEWYFRGNGEQQDTSLVEDEVNEILKSFPGLEHVSVNINCFTGSEYQQQVTLAQSAEQQIDILNTVSLTSFPQEVENGTFLELEDLLSEDLRAELPEWLWKLGSIGGHVYMVPNYQQAMNRAYFFTPEVYMEKYGDFERMEAVLTNPESSLDEISGVLEEYLYAVRAGEGETKYLPSVPHQMVNHGTGTLGFYMTDCYDSLYNDFIIMEGSDEVIYKKTAPWAVEGYAKAAEWYDKGIIYPDIMTANELDLEFGNMLNPVSYAGCFKETIGSAERAAEIYSKDWGFELTAIAVQSEYYIQNSWAAGGNGIYTGCKHPGEAIRFIEALTTGTEKGKQIYNLLVFGIEGRHYEKDETDPERIRTLEYTSSQGGVDTSYAGLKWIIGNSFYAFKNQAVLDDANEIAKELNESPDTKFSRYAGFTVSTANVSMMLDQIQAVEKEFASSLSFGVEGADGWKARYDDFAAKLRAAGIEEVLAEFQKQVDEFNGK